MKGVTLQGAERTYRIDCTNANALARLEEATGLTLPDVIEAVQQGDADPQLIAGFLGAVLVDPAEPSPDELAVILEDIGGPTVIAAAAEGLS